MGVRWIIGRAGTGKSTRCARDIHQEMARDPLGGALLWITPDQATFSAERFLLTHADSAPGKTAHGTFRAQVLSFRRLAMLIARELGLIDPTTTGTAAGGRRLPSHLGEVARTVLLEETVRQHRSELQVFGAVAGRPGFIAKLDRTLRELRQHGHSGASLREVVYNPPPSPPSPSSRDSFDADTLAARKLLDLALLLDAWSLVVDGNPAQGTDGGGGGASSLIDLERIMHAAALGMAKSPLITGQPHGEPARIWIDGISAMSTLEMRLTVALAAHAKDLTITLLADPDSPAIRDLRDASLTAGPRDPDLPIGLFSRTERLFRRLTDEFGRHRVRVEGLFPLRQQYRFKHPALQRIEARLFDQEGAATPVDPLPESSPRPLPRETAASPPAASSAPKSPPRKSRRKVSTELPLFDMREDAAPAPASQNHAETPAIVTGGVEIWETSDPETEVRVVAQAIRDLVIGTPPSAGLRYRQIGVIVPDLKAYQDALRRIFTEHNIPHFIDERRGIAHHPLVELLRSAVAIASNRWDREDLLLYMKTRLTGVSPEEAAWVENYLLEHGIDHLPWDLPWKWIAPNEREEETRRDLPASARERLARVNAVRERIWNGLRHWIHLASSTPDEESSPDAARFVRGLRALLERLDIPRQIAAWSESARRAAQPGAPTAGDDAPRSEASVELALIHEQAWREVDAMLAMLETMLTGKDRSLQEFERILSTALESLTLGLIPPTVDQVLISSVTRSRVPQLEAAFLVGATEGKFPHIIEEDAILSDAQRAAFNARAGNPIGDGSDRQLLEMPFFDYIALTRAARLLVISYPVADRQGRALGRSRYLARIRDLLPAGELGERRFDAASRTDLDRIGTREDLLLALASWARGQIDPPAPGVWAPTAMDPLYNWALASPDLFPSLQTVWRALASGDPPRLAPQLAARFYPPGQPLRMSVSQLERFAACPLQYFMEYTLGLRQRRELALDVMDLGILYHRILEKVYRRIIADEIAWPRCEDGSLRNALEAEVDAAIEELHAELAQRTPGYDKMRDRTKRTLGIILEADRRRACEGSMRPEAVEIYFGAQARQQNGRIVSLPLFPIPSARGHTVLLNGKIDRIDRAESGDDQVSVIDYKSTSQKRLDLCRVFHGLSLQLPVYALVMRSLQRQHPIAALYMALGIRRKNVDHRGDATAPDTDDFYQQFKPRGVIDQAFYYRLEPIAENERARWYCFGFTQKHEPRSDSEAIPHEDFETLLAFTLLKIGDLADQLMAGEIAPSPYRGAGGLGGKEIPCTQCDYASLCPFDRVSGAYRDIPRLSKAESLSRMHQRVREAVPSGGF